MNPILVSRTLAFASVVLTASAAAQTPRKVTRLAQGVYAIEHKDNADGFASGNSTVIIGDRQVLIVDAGFLPADAREDIAQIREWTKKPVAFLLNTHFHNDHNLTNRVYLDAFPGLTIIAHAETRRDMDLFGPGSAERVNASNARLNHMLELGKNREGRALTAQEKKQLEDALAHRVPLAKELAAVPYQSPTLVFEHDFTIDLGDRGVEIKFLGRGNTAGDAIAYLPRERIVVTGDLVVHPIPYIYDGYPSEWVGTLERLAQLDAGSIVPGHGPIMHDKTYLLLTHDLLKSAVDQMIAQQRKLGPAMFRTLDEMKAGVTLTPFRPRFAGKDKDLALAFDDMAANLVRVTFNEAGLR